MHAVPCKAITWKHIHKKLLKLTSRNVKIRSTLSSNKHWRFGLQASLFQNWSEYLQTGSCASAVQYSITVKKERQSIDIAIPTHTYSFCLYGIESKGLFKQGFFFFFDTTIGAARSLFLFLVTEKYSFLLSPHQVNSDLMPKGELFSNTVQTISGSAFFGKLHYSPVQTW